MADMAVEEPAAPCAFPSVLDFESEASLRAALAEPPYTNGSAPPSTDFGSCFIDGSVWQSPHLDLATSIPMSTEEETKRLMTLKEYCILDSDQEEKFERMTALASRIFDVPICLVSLVDIGRQWFMSNRGLGDVRETSRQVSFCAHAIVSKQDVFVVPDTYNDPRFVNNGLVTGQPYIRFYAGAPLISPEGYKLGTFCIIDSKPRPEGLSLSDKQNLRELAAMVMETMVSRKKDLQRIRDEKTRLIACAAHDLLSPLTGVQLNLELLMEDEALSKHLDDHQRELMTTAIKCSGIIERICLQAIESFRGGLARSFSDDEEEPESKPEEGLVNIAKLVENVNQVVATYPKNVPLFIEVDDNVPPAVISDDLKLFRSILNYLTNACKQTQSGTIRLRIYVRKAVESATGLQLEILPGALVAPKRDVLIVEVHDTGPGVDLEKYPSLFTPLAESNKVQHCKMPNSGLGLYSVATEISSLGGEYGVFPREDLAVSHPDHETSVENLLLDDTALTGSVFWFSVPLVLPTSPNSPPNRDKEVTAMNVERANCSISIPTTGGDKFDSVAKNEGAPDPKLMPPPETTPEKAVKRRSFQIEDTDVEFDIEVTKKKQALTENVLPLRGLSNSLSSVYIKKKNPERARRVIIIDDSLTIRKGLARGFSRLGFEVDQAENGMQGFKMLKKTLYDLVLLDFLMPVMDGVDVAKKFRAWETLHRQGFHQYIVGVSAHANGKDAEVGLKAGMDRFMGKPVPLKSLKDLAECKPVMEARVILDRKFTDSVRAFEETERIAEARSDEERSKSSGSLSTLNENAVRQTCLIAQNKTETKIRSLRRLVEACGWCAVVVNNGNDAERMLKMRNWGIVFIDDDLQISGDNSSRRSGASIVPRFRDWEKRSRVVRQKNIYLLSDTYSPFLNSLPSGFDGVVEKPFCPSHVSNVLDSVSKETLNIKGNREILLR